MKWISVKDRLPEVYTKVLVLTRNNKVTISDRYLHRDVAYWSGSGTFVESITHWMPLPAPPSEPINEVTLTREWLEWEKKRRESMIKDSVESDKEWKEYLKGRLAQINDIIKMMEE